jgi:hypothetical protein
VFLAKCGGPEGLANSDLPGEKSSPAVNITQIVLVLAVLILWLWLLNSWRLRNWRAVTLGAVGTIAVLAAGMLPNPTRAVAQAGIWLVVGWVFLFRSELVGVMSPAEYDYVDAHIQILRRIDRQKHASDRPDPMTDLREFEANVRSLEALNAPLAWSKLHRDTVRELERRLTIMKARTLRSPEDLRALDDRWLEVGQLFRETLKARAGFWTGWPISPAANAPSPGQEDPFRTMTAHESAMREFKRRLLAELETDYVGLWSAVLKARNVLGVGPGQATSAVLSVLAELLEAGEVVVGFPTKDGRGFQVWRASPRDAIRRIEREWSELGRDPDIAEIAWLATATRPRLEPTPISD